MKECRTHKFVKFDEDRIFCERCGLFMLAARQAPVYPYVPYVYPYWTVTAPTPFKYTVWNGSTTTVKSLPDSTFTFTGDLS